MSMRSAGRKLLERAYYLVDLWATLRVNLQHARDCLLECRTVVLRADFRSRKGVLSIQHAQLLDALLGRLEGRPPVRQREGRTSQRPNIHSRGDGGGYNLTTVRSCSILLS